jgi:NAD(P)-dependent dehydrogenase (short-subunit alcohol dehydrogenase family)
VRFSDINQEPGKVIAQEDMPRRGLPKGMLKGNGGYEPAVAYGQSKTANILFAVGLNKRLARKRLKGLAVMPGGEFDGLLKSRVFKGIRDFTKADVLIQTS